MERNNIFKWFIRIHNSITIPFYKCYTSDIGNKKADVIFSETIGISKKEGQQNWIHDATKKISLRTSRFPWFCRTIYYFCKKAQHLTKRTRVENYEEVI